MIGSVIGAVIIAVAIALQALERSMAGAGILFEHSWRARGRFPVSPSEGTCGYPGPDTQMGITDAAKSNQPTTD